MSMYLTFTYWRVVAPRGKHFCHPLAGDAFGALQHVIAVTREPDHCSNAFRMNMKTITANKKSIGWIKRTAVCSGCHVFNNLINTQLVLPEIVTYAPAVLRLPGVRAVIGHLLHSSFVHCRRCKRRLWYRLAANHYCPPLHSFSPFFRSLYI